MQLLIDAGNTRIKWGIADSAMVLPLAVDRLHWHRLGAVEHSEIEQLASAWHGLPVQRVLVSNVAGKALRERLQALLYAAFGLQVEIDWFVAQANLAGVQNGYRDPQQLGCDRFASVIGAHALFPRRALIVATCGTATTVDAVTSHGVFIGGMILPGLGVMATSLALNTAQLPQIHEIRALPQLFANNTNDAIIAGCIAAQTGAIERAVATHRQQQEDVLCVLAGGAGKLLMPYLAVACESIDNLVLIGLHVVAISRC